MGQEELEDAATGRPYPPNPPNEEERLKVSAAIFPDGGLGDGAPEDAMLQSMCKTICKLFNVPIAAVSIVQKDTYTMRACQGLPPQFKIPRRDAFCAWTLLPKQPETLVIEDMTKDKRFMEHPNVLSAPGGLRFYAGSPLVTATSHLLGAVCILDCAPRKMTAEQYNLLNNFSELAIRRLEDKHFPDLKANAKLLRAPDDAAQPVVLCDLSNSRWWSILYSNTPFAAVAGVPPEALVDNSFWKLFRPANNEAKNKVLEQLEEQIHAGRDFTLQARRREAGLDGAAAARDSTFEIIFRPATKQNLGSHAAKICVPNIVDAVELGSDNATSTYFFAAVEKPGEKADTAATPSAGLARSPRQQTFYSKEYALNFPVTSKQPVSEGMKDVTMGVLCTQGSNALVYRGRWRKKAVAVKVIEAKQADCIRAPAFGAAYVPKEGALCLDLDHPNIMTTFKIVTENVSQTKSVKAWLVREWAGLGTVADAIQRGWLNMPDKTPNKKVVLQLAREIANGMEYIHSQDIIHGCLDTTSISLAEAHRGSHKQTDFTPKLSDFSHSCKAEDTADSLTISTPSHASPEQFSKGQISKASDVYSFGMLFWELTNGQLVWPSLNVEQVQKRVLAREVPTMPENYSQGVKSLLADCLAFKPKERPSFAQIGKRLAIMEAELAAGQPVTGLEKKEEAAVGKGRLFRDRATSMKEEKAGDNAAPAILSQASQETADAQKKSVFKRFAAKFKT